MTSRLLHRASKAFHNLPLPSSLLPSSSCFSPPQRLSMIFLHISDSGQREQADKTYPDSMLHMLLTLGESEFQCLPSLCVCFDVLLKCIFKPTLHISLSYETFLSCPCSSMISSSPSLGPPCWCNTGYTESCLWWSCPKDQQTYT